MSAIDLFADVDLAACAEVRRTQDYPLDLPMLARTLPAGPWMYTGGLENHVRVVEEICGDRMLLGNCAEVLKRVRNPLTLQQFLQSRSLPNIAVSMQESKELRGGKWLRKPVRGCSGNGIAIYDPTLSRFPEKGTSGDWYYQQFVSGVSASAVFAANGRNAALLGITQQLVGPPWTDNPFQYAGSIGPLSASNALRDEIEAIGQALAAEFRLVGLFGIDGIICNGIASVRPSSFYTVEVNPRYTSSCEVVERMLGTCDSASSLVSLHAAACHGGELPARPSPLTSAHSHGKLIVFARRKCSVDVRWADWFEQENRSGVRIADIPPQGTSFDVGDPMFTLLAWASTTEEVLDELAKRAEIVADRFAQPTV